MVNIKLIFYLFHHKIEFSADIETVFLQIFFAEGIKYLQFLYYKDVSKN